MTRLPVIAAALLLSALPAAAQVVTATSAAPVEHRLTPDEIAAAQAEGAERNRAAELLAMSRGDPSLALPAEKKKAVHGEVGFGVGSNGARDVFGSATTDVNGASVTVAGDYQQFGRTRNRPF